MFSQSWSSTETVKGKGCLSCDSLRTDFFQFRYKIAGSNIPHSKNSSCQAPLDWIMAEKEIYPHSSGHKSVRLADRLPIGLGYSPAAPWRDSPGAFSTVRTKVRVSFSWIFLYYVSNCSIWISHDVKTYTVPVFCSYKALPLTDQYLSQQIFYFWNIFLKN